MIYQIIVFICFIVVIFLLLHSNRKLTKKLGETSEKLATTLSQKKKSEVNTGMILEKAVPFLEVFKHETRDTQFLFNPIDYIVFERDKIILGEIKTGKARLTPKQKRIKYLVENNMVEFELIRIKPEN